MIQKLLHSQQKSISSASLILAVSYFLSALLGLARDRLLAGTFGAGSELDVYYTAFTVPDFIALILIFGAISAAVIPIFSSYLIKSKEEAFKYLSTLLNVFLGFLIVICFVLIIFTPWIISAIAPGFSGEKKELAVSLMRIMFLSPIILGASNIVSGILQVFHRFLATALAPLMYNLGIIIGIVFFAPRLGLAGLAWGVVLGGVLHLLIQIPSLVFSGFKYRPDFNFGDKGVLRTIKLMAPRSLGLGAGQLNTIATTAIASTLATGSIAVFNLANNLSGIFVNAVAVSVTTASFPSMAMAFIKQENEEFLRKFSLILRQIFFLVLPVSILLFLLRAQIVRVFFGVGKFDWLDTRLTSACLGILAVNLIAQALILFLSKTFYAAHNTKIPAVISIATVIFNIMLSLSLVALIKFNPLVAGLVQNILKLEGVNSIGVIGLALAFSTTAIIEAILLLVIFCKKFPAFDKKEIIKSLQKTFIACIVMAVTAFAARQITGSVLRLDNFWSVFLQMVFSGGLGAAAYILAVWFLKSEELKLFAGSLMRKFLAQPK